MARFIKIKRRENRFILFWKEELPAVMITAHKQLLYAFVIFVVAGIIGAVSVAYDDTFVRLILSDGYVNMTLENIKKGNPTEVYSSSGEMDMFFMITLNNIMVSIRVFVLGVMASLGTGLMLFYNAVMVGTFMMFFYQESQLSQALPVIMLHGTIELTSIVIAAAAGFIMGNSILFPGTYSRLASFKMGAIKGLKIVMGLVPFFYSRWLYRIIYNPLCIYALEYQGCHHWALRISYDLLFYHLSNSVKTQWKNLNL
ncbi:MAG: membrane protein [Bacteroidetes bacterium OLB12]|nr:MAG: membrane protein [Bacteroidetes bacterium OLB12]